MSTATNYTTISTKKPSINGNDFGGSGDFGTTDDDDEDGREGTATTITTPTILTTLQTAKDTSNLTKHVQTTLSQFMPTEFSTVSDFDASGDDDNENETGEDDAVIPTAKLVGNTTTLVTTTQPPTESREPFADITTIDDTDDFFITGDERVTGQDEEDKTIKVINSTTTSTLTTYHQKKEFTTQIQMLNETTDHSRTIATITLSTESNSIEGSGDFFTDDEDEGKGEQNRDTASTTTLISNNTAFLLTTLEQKGNENANETTSINTPTQPLERATELYTEAIDVEASGDKRIFRSDEDMNENSTDTSATGLQTNTETSVSITSHQTTSRTSSTEVINTNQLPLITDTTSSSESNNTEANDDIDEGTDGEDKKNASITESIGSSTTVTLQDKGYNETITRIQPIIESMEHFTETVDVEASGDDDATGDDEDTNHTETISTIELAAIITTHQAITGTSSAVVNKTNLSVTDQINSENDNFEASGDLFITEEDGDDGQEDTNNAPTTKLIGNSTTYTLQQKEYNENSNETIVASQPFKESTQPFTKSADRDSGDIEIIVDDEDIYENSTSTSTTELIRTTEVLITSQQTINRTNSVEVIKSNESFSTTDRIFSTERDEIEGSGGFFITGDDEDDDQDIFGVSTTPKLLNTTETHSQQVASNKSITNVPIITTQSETEDLEASGDRDTIGDDEELIKTVEVA